MVIINGHKSYPTMSVKWYLVFNILLLIIAIHMGIFVVYM
jgi:hypothetical protein